MPKGPQGQNRPADAVANAVMVARIATGEIEEDIVGSVGGRRSAKAGGAARGKRLDANERRNQDSKEENVRWG